MMWEVAIHSAPAPATHPLLMVVLLGLAWLSGGKV